MVINASPHSAQRPRYLGTTPTTTTPYTYIPTYWSYS